MNNFLTKLSELEVLEKNATKGKWIVEKSAEVLTLHGIRKDLLIGHSYYKYSKDILSGYDWSEKNFNLIAASRNSLPFLLRAMREMYDRLSKHSDCPECNRCCSCSGQAKQLLSRLDGEAG